MSAQGNCYDNAKAEAFFSTLKTGCFPAKQVFDAKSQARREIFEYIEVYYNNQRIHSSLGYQTPRQFEALDNERKSVGYSVSECVTKFKGVNGINGG
jgi:transposase InsO family protein